MDAFVSFYWMLNTSSHSLVPNNPDFHKEFPDSWEALFSFALDLFYDTYMLYIKLAEDKRIPIYFFKYENVVADKKGEIMKLFSFLLH
jgi:hypothetical protein